METTSTNPRTTWLRPRRLLAVAALCLLLGLGLVAFGWFPQERVRQFVEERMREAVGPRSRIGALHVVPGSLSADIRELTLEGPTYRIEVPHARVRATVAMITRGIIDLRSLEASGARITLRPPQDTTEPTPRPDVRIQSLRLMDAVVTYEDERLGGPVRVEGLDVSGSIGEGALVATARGGTWAREPEVPIGPVSLRAHVSRGLDFGVESFDGGTPRSRVRASGRIANADPMTLAVNWEAALDLGELSGYAPRPLSASGALQAKGTVTGTTDAPAARGSASGEAVRVEDWAIDHADAELAYDTSSARVSWTARALGGSITGDATLAGDRLDAKALADGLDTRRLPASVAPEGLPPSRIAGRLTAQGPTDGPLQVAFDLKASGSQGGMTHQATAQGGGRVEPKASRVNVEWRGTLALAQPLAEGATGWRRVQVRAQGGAAGALPPAVTGTLNGTADLRTATGPQQMTFDGRVRNQGSDVEATLDARGLGGAAHASVKSRGSVVLDLRAHAQGLDVSPFANGAAGTLDADLQASGPIDRLDGRGTARATGLRFQGVEVGAASAELTSTAGRGQARFEVPALNVTGDATLDARRMTGRVVLAETPLQPFQPLLPEGRPLEGVVSGTADVTVAWAEPEDATMTAQVTTAELVSGSLQAAATAPFTIGWSRQRARVEGLEVEGEGLRVRASGSAGLGAADPIDARVRVEGDLQQVEAPEPWALSGTFAVDARLSGTRTAPRADGAIDASDVIVSGVGEAPLLALPQARVDLRGDRIAIEGVQGEIAGGTLTASGEAPLAALLPPAPGAAPSREVVRAEVEVAGADAGALAGSLHSLAVPVEGTLSARLTVEGRPAAHELRGSLAAPATTVRVDDVPLELGPLVAHADGSRVVLEPWTVGSLGSQVVTQGRADLKSRAIEGSSSGRLNLRALSPLLEQGALAGSADLDVTVAGTLDAPRADGGVALTDASLRLREIPQAITDINGRAVLDGRVVRLEDVQGEWGGGTLSASGTAGLAADVPTDLKLLARDVSLRYPRDFRSRLRADLTLTGPRDAMLLAGEVHAERGLYDTDIHLEETLLAPSIPPPAETESPLMQAIALDLSVVTDRPILVRNNLAELEASGSLRIRGDARYPAPFGRLQVREGGKVFLQTREFTIQSGTLYYNGTLDPEISVTAETVISQVDDEDVHVTAVASGPLERPTLDLKSDPSYTEREIASLIATGRRGVTASGTAWAAGEHTAALLAGRLTQNLSRSLRDFGLDEVDIQPELLAREEDPGARFTFGKLLTPKLKLIYSLGLNDPEARFFQAQYRFRIGREITAKVQREDGGAFSYGAGQRWRWGGDRSGGRRRGGRRATDDTVTLTELRFTGVPPELEARARARVGVEPGSDVDFWRLQDEAESVQTLLHSGGYLEALVSADLEGSVGVIDARPGARYAWMVEGLPGAPDLTPEMQSAFFEEEAVENGRARLLEAARARGFAKARVEVERRGDDHARTLVFVVTPGDPAVIRAVTFPGASALGHGELVDAAGGELALLNDPVEARDRIVAAYREARYMAAKVELPRVRETEDRGAVTIEVAVEEGPEALLAEVTFEGTTHDETELGDAARIETGLPYDPLAVEDAVQRIRAYYLERGYASVRVQPRLEPRDTDLDLVLRIVEGEQQFVGDVVFKGLRRTKESTVRRVIPFKKGDPLDPRALTILERRLLDLDVFRRAAASASSGRNATITVEVREQGPYTLQYDVRSSREEGVSGLVDAEVGNIAGTALALGARFRAGADIRETRGSLHLPALGRSADITGAVFRQDEDFLLLREGGLPLPAFVTTPDTERQQGFEIQQSWSAPRRWDVLYGYRFKQIESLTRDFKQDVAGLQMSLLRETRDNPLDAREGAFLSLSVELGPRFLGSDFAFFRILGQGFFARPVGRTLTWAQGYRVGVANGLDEQLLQQAEVFGRSTEAFRAGGAHTLRGFATDSVGPQGPVPGFSRGGEALLVLNQEIRYRHPTGIGLAAFYDVGNVYEDMNDLTSLSLRHSIGAGVRYESPIGLLRLDFGFPLNKRPIDRPYQWFFSLGQAF